MVKRMLCLVIGIMFLFGGNGDCGVLTGGDYYVAPANFDDLTLVWFCETTSAEYSAGDTTALLDGGSLTTDAVKYGANGLDCPAGEDWAIFDISNYDIVNTEKGRLAFWVKHNSLSTNTQTILNIKEPAAFFKIIAYTDGHITTAWLDPVNERYSDSATGIIAIGEWKYIEVEWQSVGTDYIKLFVDGELVIDATGAIAPFNATTLNIGNSTSSANDIYIDSLMISDLSNARDFYNDTYNGTTLKELTVSPR